MQWHFYGTVNFYIFFPRNRQFRSTWASFDNELNNAASREHIDMSSIGPCLWFQLVTEVPVGIGIQAKNRLVCVNAVTGIWGSCGLLASEVSWNNFWGNLRYGKYCKRQNYLTTINVIFMTKTAAHTWYMTIGIRGKCILGLTYELADLYFCSSLWKCLLGNFGFLQLSGTLSLKHVNFFPQAINSLCESVHKEIL